MIDGCSSYSCQKNEATPSYFDNRRIRHPNIRCIRPMAMLYYFAHFLPFHILNDQSSKYFHPDLENTLHF